MSQSIVHRSAPLTLAAIPPSGPLSIAFALLRLWQERATLRGHLAGLDARLVGDAGLDREAIAAEIAKPFWRA